RCASRTPRLACTAISFGRAARNSRYPRTAPSRSPLCCSSIACRNASSGEDWPRTVPINRNAVSKGRSINFKSGSRDTKMGWPKPSHFKPRCGSVRLEEELHSKLDNPVTLFTRDHAESRIILLQSGFVEAEVEIAPVEGPQRMIQPVVAVHTELHT